MANSNTTSTDPAALLTALTRLAAAKISGRSKTAVGVARTDSTHKATTDESAATPIALQDSGVTAAELPSLGLPISTGFAECRAFGAASATPPAPKPGEVKEP